MLVADTAHPNNGEVAQVVDPEHILALYIESDGDLHALAQHTGLDLLTILEALDAPPIRARLDALCRTMQRAGAFHRIHTRQTALAALEHIVRTTDDLVEKRRAASAILRALAPATAHSRPARKAQPDAPPARELPPLPDDTPQALVAHVKDALTKDAPLESLRRACFDDATLNDEPMPPDLEDLQTLAPEAHDVLTNVADINDRGEAQDENTYAHMCVAVHRRLSYRIVTFHCSPLTTVGQASPMVGQASCLPTDPDENQTHWRIHAIDIVEQQPVPIGQPYIDTPTPKPRPPPCQ